MIPFVCKRLLPRTWVEHSRNGNPHALTHSPPSVILPLQSSIWSFADTASDRRTWFPVCWPIGLELSNTSSFKRHLKSVLFTRAWAVAICISFFLFYLFSVISCWSFLCKQTFYELWTTSLTERVCSGPPSPRYTSAARTRRVRGSMPATEGPSHADPVNSNTAENVLGDRHG